MKNIIAIGASNSKNSINKKLAAYAAGQVDRSEVTVIGMNDFDLPLYGIDEEKNNGIPRDALKLDNMLNEADGLVVSLAEHNGSYTAAFKNAFDWLSRIDQNVWKKKPMLLLSTSPGQRGGASVLETAKVSFPFLGGNVIESFPFPSFYDNFKDGSISNSELKHLVGDKIKRFQASLTDHKIEEELESNEVQL